MKTEPIKSQEAADRVFEFLVKVTIKIMKVDRPQAEKRIVRLLESGDLKGLHFEDTKFQMIVDSYMRKPV